MPSAADALRIGDGPENKHIANMKLYVGNLSFQTTEGALEELFAQFGTVTEAMLVMDKMTQRPRGFGFVTMGTAEEAQKAIDALNGKNVDGRNLIVNEARPREERPPRRDFGGGGGGPRRHQHGKGGGYRDRR
jgi:cold-inducible RNA-binding protein